MLVLIVASWSAYRFLRRQVGWSGILISLRIFQFFIIHTVKVFRIVNISEVDGFLEFSSFSINQWMFAIWSLVLLPFLNPDSTSRSSQFIYCWTLTWRILSITLLACEMSATLRYFEHSLALPFFGSEWKLTISSPVATAEFSKFAGILSAVLSQHHILGFEIAQLEFHHLH